MTTDLKDEQLRLVVVEWLVHQGYTERWIGDAKNFLHESLTHLRRQLLLSFIGAQSAIHLGVPGGRSDIYRLIGKHGNHSRATINRWITGEIDINIDELNNYIIFNHIYQPDISLDLLLSPLVSLRFAMARAITLAKVLPPQRGELANKKLRRCWNLVRQDPGYMKRKKMSQSLMDRIYQDFGDDDELVLKADRLGSLKANIEQATNRGGGLQEEWQNWHIEYYVFKYITLCTDNGRNFTDDSNPWKFIWDAEDERHKKLWQ